MGPDKVLPSAITLTRLDVTAASVRIDLNSSGVQVSGVELVAGPVDAAGNVAAWPLHVPAVPAGNLSTWNASLSGLARETTYFVRAVVTIAQGPQVSPQRLEFRTPNAKDNLFYNLLLSEIMYHPSPPTVQETAAGFEEADFEYVEIQNYSSESMDLSGLWFSGIQFDFPAVGAPVISPGGYAVIASNPHAFALRYGADIPLVGWTLHPFRNSKLSNNNENIRLRTPDGTLLFDVFYNDNPERGADGRGLSLELNLQNFFYHPEGNADYVVSRVSGGTPGRPPVPPPSQTFAAWQLLNFSAAQLNNPNVSGMNADPDNDGLANVAEYALGTHPLAVDSKDVLHISNGPDESGHKAVFLTFPVNPAAKETKIDIQGIDRTLDGWRTDCSDAVNTTANFLDQRGYSLFHGQDTLTSDNDWYSAVLSPDGSQLFVTRRVLLLNVLPEANQRLFRLKIQKP
jgi:hypothetical protein